MKALTSGNFEIIFSIVDFSPNVTAGAASGTFVGFGGKVFKLKGFIEAMREAQKILGDKKLIDKIVKRAYDLEVRPVLLKRLRGRTLKRGGRGSGWSESSGGNSEEQSSDRNKTKNTPRLGFTPRGDELGAKWKQVYDLIYSPIKEVAPGVYQGFSMREILNIKVKSSKSSFTGVYLMAEFGTGEVADPGPRRYQSKKTTPYKVSPTLAQFGGNTAWWFTFPKSIMIAKNILKSHNKLTRLKRKRHQAKIKGKREPNTAHLFDFAFGAKGSRSIAPRHVIFDARGVVLQLRTSIC